MGKLKSKLVELENEVAALMTKHRDSMGELKAQLDSLQNQFGVLTEGTNALYMYFVEKYKAKKDSIEKHKDATLKDVLDANAAGMIKQLMTSKAACQVCGRSVKTLYNITLPMMIKNLDEPAKTIVEIKAMIAKKKAKLLQLPKFKEKIKRYADQLDKLEKDLNATKDAVTKKVKKMPRLYDNLLSKYDFTPSTKLESIRADMISADLNGNLELMKTDWKDAQDTDAKMGMLRLETQMKQLKSWAAEADQMESESEES